MPWGWSAGVRLESRTGSAPLTPARGPAVTFDLAAAADQGQRGLDPSAAGAPVGMARPCSGGLGTNPCPLLKHELLPHPLTGDFVSFCFLPAPTTWWDWGLRSLLGEGRGTRGAKVGSSTPLPHRRPCPPQFPGFYPSRPWSTESARGPKVTSPNSRLRHLWVRRTGLRPGR